MKRVEGIWLPESDVHLAREIALPVNPRIGGKGTYQFNKYRAALEHVSGRFHAVDIGANVGLWSRVMVRDFLRVTAIEPVAEHVACFRRNVNGLRVRLIQAALGDECKPAFVDVPGDHIASAHMADAGEPVDMVTLDSLGLGHIDFLKIDVEGYELNAIRGGEKTIRNYRPVIIVEQKPDNAERYGLGQWDALELLKSWGMVEKKVIGGDHILTWP